MSKPNTPAPDVTPETTGAAPAAQTQTAPLAAASAVAPVAPSAAPNEVAELSAELSQMRARMARMRAKEDASDFRLLMAEGFSTPANEAKEIAFLGKLPEELKDDYLALRRTLPKAWAAGRDSVPPDHSPLSASTSGAGVTQDALLAQLQEQSGFKPAGK